MSSIEDRQKELTKISIKIYQQLTAEWPIDKIRSQFPQSGLEATEIDWILCDAKERYNEYTKYIEHSNKESARSQMLWSA